MAAKMKWLQMAKFRADFRAPHLVKQIETFGILDNFDSHLTPILFGAQTKTSFDGNEHNEFWFLIPRINPN